MNGDRPVLSVTDLLQAARGLLESKFPDVRVSGEITGFKVSGPGHMYFSLKDEKNLLNCVFFRSSNAGLAFKPEDGLKAVASGTLTLYEARGQFQLNVHNLEPLGLGALQLRFEQLKRKLAEEGLFETARKKPLPRFPKRVALITSPQGAAIRDFHRLLQDQASVESVTVFPVTVQGDAAPGEIVEAFRRIALDPCFDAVVLTRGGGSLEDLAAFNEETVVRALSDCPVPTVSAVGHETDFTLCDFAADVRAATPSAAAALLGPSRDEAREWVAALRARIAAALGSMLRSSRQQAGQLASHLGKRSPRRILEEARQRLDDLISDLVRALGQLRKDRSGRLAQIASSFGRSNPFRRIGPARERLRMLSKGLSRLIRSRMADVRRVLEGAGTRLEAYHPLSPLRRGYAVVTRSRDGRVLRDARHAPVGEGLNVRLWKGELDSTVTASRPRGSARGRKRGRQPS